MRSSYQCLLQSLALPSTEHIHSRSFPFPMHHNSALNLSAWRHADSSPSMCRTQLHYDIQECSIATTSSPSPSPPVHQTSDLLPDPAAEPLYLANCEWNDCPILLDDTSPAGIQRHLREWHLNDPQHPWNKSRRGHCQWAGSCGKEMAYASFGKHVSYVHLRHSIRCPYCHRDIGRAGLLPLHVRRYCPRAP
ncbi:hypothetical protein DAEQUDRAFT_733388 [Daedalea quercina L-15889]|uniref:Uncharacterized protein n=1 Tax=Daedalea quercina L-15889 TaxID=1314783 RepID=A0A165L0L8_9APHY|nr:hypothetical protein DAEQUDRAFT_733388 [Daedalea quercina L-15889]